MTPSRSAHGQMSTRVQSEPAHRRLGHHRAGQQLVRPARADPVHLAELRRRDVPDEAEHLAQPGPGQRCAAPAGPAPDGAAPASRASVRNVFEVATARSQPTAVSCVDRLVQLRRRRTRAARRRPRPAAAGRPTEPLPGQPAGAQRQRQRHLRAPRRCRRRSPASRRRCPAPAAARPTSRTTAAPPGTSSAPRPRRRAPAGRTPVSSRTRASTSAELVASRTADVAKASRSSASSAGGRRPGRRRPPRPGRPRRPRLSAPSRADLLGQPQHRLLRVRRPRVRAVVGVDHQQVHRVGADIEHTQPHGEEPRRHRVAAARRGRAATCSRAYRCAG